MQGQFDIFGLIGCPADDTPRHLESRTSYFFIVIHLTTPVSFSLRKPTFLCGEISIYMHQRSFGLTNLLILASKQSMEHFPLIV